MRSGPEGVVEESVGFSRPDARKRFRKPDEPERRDPARLAEGLLSDSPQRRAEALAMVGRRPAALAELACSSTHEDMRLDAVAALADGTALSDVASYSHFRDSRLAAVRRLEGDGGRLLAVACGSLFWDSIDAALSMMGDGERAEVAIRSRKSRARKAALSLMRDSSALLQVAEESPYRSARGEAVRRLGKDTTALCGLAVGSARTDSRKAAVAHLCPRLQELGADVLVEIAALAPEEDYRLLALARIGTDAASLRRVLQKARHWGTRTTAMMLISEMVGEIDDANLLAEIAVRSPDRDSRLSALNKLSADPAALADVARRSRYRDTRDSALARLSGDGALLRKVRLSSSYGDTRRKAHRLACGKDVLRRTLEALLG